MGRPIRQVRHRPVDRLDQYRLFLRIASCGSFTQAADQLGLPRPTVSTALQQLEAHLGARLLHRTTRHVSLTPDGEALLERVRRLVGDAEDIEQQFRPVGGRVSGRLRVDVPSRIARRLLAPALPTLLLQHAALSVDLGSSDRLADLVHEGIDCALRVGQVGAGSLVARRLGSFELVNCASPAYIQRHGVPAHPGELAHHWAVHYQPAGGARSAAWDWVEDGQPHSVAVPGRVSANHVESYIALALAGLGLVQVPAFDVQEHLDRGELVAVMPAHRPLPMPVHVVVPHRRHLSRRVQVFVQWLETVLAPHVLR